MLHCSLCYVVYYLLLFLMFVCVYNMEYVANFVGMILYEATFMLIFASALQMNIITYSLFIIW